MPKRSKQQRTAELLNAVADALNACRNAGMNLKFRHGIAQCDEGLVLDLPDGTWVARTRQYTPFPAPVGGDLDD